MATSITLTSGSVFCGNPITFDIKPMVLPSTPSFHRIMLEVTCGTSDRNMEVIKRHAPVEQESADAVVRVDVSPALRIFASSYEYTSSPTQYPVVRFSVKAYDEYMTGGEVQRGPAVVFPTEGQYMRAIFGGFSDMERILSGGSLGVTRLSRKPTTSPHLAYVGETLVYPMPYDKQQTLPESASLTAPESKETVISQEGMQETGGQQIFAMPQASGAHRTVFRFINSFGVLESVSVPRAYSQKMALTTTSYTVARQETFNRFSRGTVTKTGDRETWLFTTDPLTEAWLYWYLHEFLKSEHTWMLVGSAYVPCRITIDEEITFRDTTQHKFYSVSFSAELDIDGSPFVA